MELDTSKRAIKVRFKKFIITIISAILLSFIYLSDFPANYLNINKNYLALVVVLVYVLIFVYYHMLDLNYLYYTDAGKKIVLRYYSLRSISGKYKAIEIPKDKFVKFEIDKSFFNLKEKVILYQKMQNGIAKYPAISITSFSVDEKNELKKSLTKSLNK
jgi:hypothetical protein